MTRDLVEDQDYVVMPWGRAPITRDTQAPPRFDGPSGDWRKPTSDSPPKRTTGRRSRRRFA